MDYYYKIITKDGISHKARTCSKTMNSYMADGYIIAHEQLKILGDGDIKKITMASHWQYLSGKRKKSRA